MSSQLHKCSSIHSTHVRAFSSITRHHNIQLTHKDQTLENFNNVLKQNYHSQPNTHLPFNRRPPTELPFMSASIFTPPDSKFPRFTLFFPRHNRSFTTHLFVVDYVFITAIQYLSIKFSNLSLLKTQVNLIIGQVEIPINLMQFHLLFVFVPPIVAFWLYCKAMKNIQLWTATTKQPNSLTTKVSFPYIQPSRSSRLFRLLCIYACLSAVVGSFFLYTFRSLSPASSTTYPPTIATTPSLPSTASTNFLMTFSAAIMNGIVSPATEEFFLRGMILPRFIAIGGKLDTDQDAVFVIKEHKSIIRLMLKLCFAVVFISLGIFSAILANISLSVQYAYFYYITMPVNPLGGKLDMNKQLKEQLNEVSLNN